MKWASAKGNNTARGGRGGFGGGRGRGRGGYNQGKTIDTWKFFGYILKLAKKSAASVVVNIVFF